MLLAGDIGGTKTNLAIYSVASGPRRPLAQQRFPSGNYSSLEALVGEFLARERYPIEQAAFGVAGPVVNGVAKITNLPWQMDERKLAGELNVQAVYLLNDLEAIANGVPALQPDDLATVNTGSPVRGGAIGVVAPGTGLGEAFITQDNSGYKVHASEGGHTDFAPMDETQMGLWQYLHRREGHVSYERVCSGLGIPNIYGYLRDSGYAEEPESFGAQLDAAHDRTPVIVQAGLNGGPGSRLCAKTLEIFASILAAEAGNLALKILAVGGIYIGGGMPPRILPLLQTEQFMHVFTDKGRFADLLKAVPVHVILHPEIALLGAARYGLDAQHSAA